MSIAIKDIANMKDKDAIDSVQGSVVKVGDAREYRGKSIQDLTLRDGTGAEVVLTAWEHGDLRVYQGSEVLVQGGPRSPISVKYDDYSKKNKIQIGKFVTIQQLSSAAKATTNTVAAATPNQDGAKPAQQGTIAINGAKIGMALNNATLFMTAAGDPYSSDNLWQMASDIIRLSNKMEQGELAPEKANPF